MLHYQDPKTNVFYYADPPSQQVQTLPQFKGARTFRQIEEERYQNVYNIVYILFAVLIGILVDLVFGSPFLKSIGVIKGGGFFAPVSPFVSSISSNAVPPPL